MQKNSQRNIKIGDSFEKKVKITSQLVEEYARVSGDINPIHLDDDYAASTRFGRRIAHGMLFSGFISAILANDFPGIGTIYVEQNLKFKAPIFIGDEVKVLVECKDILEKSRYKLITTVTTQEGVLAIDGEALVIAS